MRRFLGGTPTTSNISAPPETSDSYFPNVAASPTTPPRDTNGGSSGPGSATKRALQTFGQLAYNKSINLTNGLRRTPSGNQPDPAETPASDTRTTAIDTAVARTPQPPRKTSQASNGSLVSPNTRKNQSAASWDANPLPFSSSLGASSSVNGSSHASQGSNGYTNKDGLLAQSAFSITQNYAANASNLVDLKDQMMMELLSSDALLHVSHFQILAFDEVEQLRKEHSLLSNRLSTLTNKLAIETKIRDAAVSLSKLYTTKRLSRQADDSVEAASRKVEAIDNEINRIARREAEVRTKILRHMAAVLALSLRRVEGSLYGKAPAPALPLSESTRTLTASPDALLSRSVRSPSLSLSSASMNASRSGTSFEGPHLFAGHKDATLAYSRSMNGHSPSLASTVSTMPSSVSAGLEGQLNDLRKQLEESTSQLEARQMTIEDLRSHNKELSAQLDKQGEMQSIQHASQREIDELRSHNEDLLAQLDRQTYQSQSMKAMHEASQREMAEEADQTIADLRRETSRLKDELEQSTISTVELQERCRQLQADHQKDQQNLLQSLQETLRQHSSRDASLAQAVPPSVFKITDLSTFIQHQLPSVFSDVSTLHQQACQENDLLRDQLSKGFASSKEEASRAIADAKREQDALQRERDTLQRDKNGLAARVAELERDKAGLDRALHDMQRDLDEQAALAEKQRKEAEKLLQRELEEAEREMLQRCQQLEEEKRSIQSQSSMLQLQLQQAHSQIEATEEPLKRIWNSLPTPSVLQARSALQASDDISKYKAAFSANQASGSAPRTPFSMDRLLLTLDAVIAADERAMSKLASYDENASMHKAAAQRGERLLQESKSSLETYAKENKALQERLQTAGKREAQVLDRVNDLQASCEQARSAAKRAEKDVTDLQQRCLQLEQDHVKVKSADEDRIKQLQKQLEDVQEELVTAQDELDELRGKESRQRMQLLDELTTLTDEASTLRTQLRAAQRKLQAAGKA